MFFFSDEYIYDKYTKAERKFVGLLSSRPRAEFCATCFLNLNIRSSLCRLDFYVARRAILKIFINIPR